MNEELMDNQRFVLQFLRDEIRTAATIETIGEKINACRGEKPKFENPNAIAWLLCGGLEIRGYIRRAGQAGYVISVRGKAALAAYEEHATCLQGSRRFPPEGIRGAGV